MSMQASHKISSTGHPRYLHRTALIAALTLGATVSQSFAADAPTFQEGVSAEQSLVSQSIEPFAASSSLQLAFMGEETAIDSLKDGATDYVLKQRMAAFLVKS